MGRQLLGQLVAAPISVALVLGRVHIGRLLEDLARKLVVVEVRLLGRLRRHPRAVDSDRRDAHHPRARTQRQHLTKEAAERVLVL